MRYCNRKSKVKLTVNSRAINNSSSSSFKRLIIIKMGRTGPHLQLVLPLLMVTRKLRLRPRVSQSTTRRTIQSSSHRISSVGVNKFAMVQIIKAIH